MRRPAAGRRGFYACWRADPSKRLGRARAFIGASGPARAGHASRFEPEARFPVSRRGDAFINPTAIELGFWSLTGAKPPQKKS